MFGRSANLPARLGVAFPADPGDPEASKVLETVALATLPGFADAQGSPGTRIWTEADGGAIAPGARAALTRQVALDHAGWHAVGHDLRLAGVVAWEPEAHTEAVVWTYRDDDVSTRLGSGPVDDDPVELAHDLGGGGSSAGGADETLRLFRSPPGGIPHCTDANTRMLSAECRFYTFDGDQKKLSDATIKVYNAYEKTDCPGDADQWARLVDGAWRWLDGECG